MRLFIGLNVSLAKTAICAVSEHGKIVREAEIVSEPESLLAWLQAPAGDIAAMGFEAGPLVTVVASWADGCRAGCCSDGNAAGERRLEGRADQD